MLDFPKVKLIRGHRAYTYFGEIPYKAKAMQFFVDPPLYHGWEVCPPEKIPGDIDAWERFERKRSRFWYYAIQSNAMYSISQLCFLLGALSCCHSIFLACCSGCCKAKRVAAQDAKKGD